MTLRRILGNLAKSLDSSAIGSYLSKGASETDFRAILYSEISGTPSVVGDSAVATAIVDSAYVQARQGSTTGLTNIDSAASLAILDSDYMQSRITGGGVGFKVYHFETTNGQTTFQDSDADGDVLGYTENGILVFKNGVLLLDSSDYTASDGTSVVLTSGTDSGELVSIAKWSLGGGAAGIVWGGDRALVGGGYLDGSSTNAIDYYDITTPGNASDFGDLTTTRDQTEATGNTTYSLFAGPSNVIDYVTAATIGNATDFGDLLTAGYWIAPASDGTYGYFCGGIRSNNNYQGIDYVTIASPGNASDYGDLSYSRAPGGGMGNTSTIVVAGGYDNDFSPYKTNIIDYFTAGTPGNASDFGDLTAVTFDNSAANDATYGLIFLNDAKAAIDYITIATPGNATDFGDAVSVGYSSRTCGNATRACHNGNNRSSGLGFNDTIQYVTFTTPGNATDFGDLVGERRQSGAASGSPS